MADFYVTAFRVQVQTQLQYRAATYMYTLGMVAEPTIYLVVWSTIARSHGGSVNGLTPHAFAAYYIVWARADDEHRLHALRLRAPHPRGADVCAAPEAVSPDPLRPRLLRGAEGA